MTEDTHVEHGLRLVIVVAGVSIAAVMQFLDSTIVNVALPIIGGNLSATFDEIGWVVTAYSLAAIAVIPLTGWLSLRFGRKKYFLISIAGFTVASALCGLSSTFPQLIVARIVQGLFGGGLVATSQAILVSSFPRQRQAVAQGIFAMIAVLGPGLGPTLGGWLTDQFNWPLIFFINLPLGVFCMIALGTTLREWPSERKPIDVLGIFLLVSGLACLQYFLERGEIKQWFDDPGIRITAFWAAVGLIWFVYHALRVEHPVLELRTLRHRNLALAALATFALGANLFGSLLILPLYLQNALGFTALGAGMLLALRALPTAILAPLSTFLLQHGLIAPRVAAAFGFLALAGGTYTIAQSITSISDSHTFVPAMVFIGIAFAFLWTPLGIISLRGLPQRELGYGAAIFNLSAQIGGAVSIAIVTAMQARRDAFWWSSLAEGVNRRNIAVQQASQHVNMHDLLIHLQAGIAQQAGILAYRDLLLMLVIPALIAVPIILMTRATTVTAPR